MVTRRIRCTALVSLFGRRYEPKLSAAFPDDHVHPSGPMGTTSSLWRASIAVAAISAVVSACGGGPPTAPGGATGVAAYTVSGTVRDALTAQPIPAALVEVTDGPFAGTASRTDAGGSYQLLSLAGSPHIHITRAGYRENIVQLGPLTAPVILDISLERTAAAGGE
jgi:Carboxypeptidase regulatory-like domain